MANKTLYIDRTAFINWYFDDEMIKTFFADHKVLKSLMFSGEFIITAEELLDKVGYLPAQVVFAGQKPVLDENDEVVMSHYDKFEFLYHAKQPV